MEEPKALVFTLPCGLMVPSEGTLADVQRIFGTLQCQLWEAVHPVTKTRSLIIMGPGLHIIEVPLWKITTGRIKLASDMTN